MVQETSWSVEALKLLAGLRSGAPPSDVRHMLRPTMLDTCLARIGQRPGKNLCMALARTLLSDSALPSPLHLLPSNVAFTRWYRPPDSPALYPVSVDGSGECPPDVLSRTQHWTVRRIKGWQYFIARDVSVCPLHTVVGYCCYDTSLSLSGNKL
jgi:hypothetical protein